MRGMPGGPVESIICGNWLVGNEVIEDVLQEAEVCSGERLEGHVVLLPEGARINKEP